MSPGGDLIEGDGEPLRADGGGLCKVRFICPDSYLKNDSKRDDTTWGMFAQGMRDSSDFFLSIGW
jgi:hypothetical protein